MSSIPVHFRFVGNGAIPNRDWEVERSALTNFPNSVLCKLAEDMWKVNASAGDDPSNPILSHPLHENSPCSDNWSGGMVELIDRVYKRQTEEEKIVLPPGVELEDALPTLEYYGIPVDSPKEQIDFSSLTDRVTRLRSLLFLANLEACETIKTFVLNHLDRCPQITSRFLFLQHSHNFDYIKEHNSKAYIKVVNSWGTGEDACLEMVQNTQFRARLVSELKAEGLEAEFCSENVNLAGPHRENEYDRREMESQLLHVLKVTLPESPSKKQRR